MHIDARHILTKYAQIMTSTFYELINFLLKKYNAHKS